MTRFLHLICLLCSFAFISFGPSQAIAQDKINVKSEGARAVQLFSAYILKGTDGFNNLLTNGYTAKRRNGFTVYRLGRPSIGVMINRGGFVEITQNVNGCRIRLHGVRKTDGDSLYRSFLRAFSKNGYTSKRIRKGLFMYNYMVKQADMVSYSGDYENGASIIAFFRSDDR